MVRIFFDTGFFRVPFPYQQHNQPDAYFEGCSHLTSSHLKNLTNFFPMPGALKRLHLQAGLHV